MANDFKLTAIIATLIIMSVIVSAQDDLCCIFSPLMDLLRPVLNVFGIATTTTTTTSTTSTTVASTSTSTTRTTTTETIVTYTTTTTTTSTLRPGGCNSYLDCPVKQVVLKCRGPIDQQIIMEETTVFACVKPATNESQCKGNVNAQIVTTCKKNFKCVEGSRDCVRIEQN